MFAISQGRVKTLQAQQCIGDFLVVPSIIEAFFNCRKTLHCATTHPSLQLNVDHDHIEGVGGACCGSSGNPRY
jgi:hypothetical protein